MAQKTGRLAWTAEVLTAPQKDAKLLRAQRKTGQCFALNGAIFLGSVLLWERVMAPGARFLLAASLKVGCARRLARTLPLAS